jgi:hypothetical protein
MRLTQTRFSVRLLPRQCFLAISLLPVLLFATSVRGEVVEVRFDKDVPQAGFAAEEIVRVLTDRGAEVIPGNLENEATGGDATRIWLFDKSNTRMQAEVRRRAVRTVGPLQSEGYALRVVEGSGGTDCFVVGADAAGVMYGGLELAERLAIGSELSELDDEEHEPYMAMRGTKFNIPLDVRTPSYTDVCDAAQHNIPEMWSFAFWKEYIDALARYRYNYVSLWSLHPFPSLVKCPDFPDVALEDVQRSTVEWEENYSLNGLGFDAPEIVENVEIVKQMTIDDKIAFWRKVMRYGKDRNIDFYFVTWNIFVNGTDGKYGITDDIDNPVTVKYFRQSVEQMFLTYPDLAGIGLTTGENMPGSGFKDKEDWAYATYAQGVLDVVRRQPERRVTFIHRQHMTGAQDIARKFAPLIEHPNVEFIFSFKYAKAHVMSATRQPYHESFVKDIGDLKTIWTLRNDDNYYFRWGAPDFVREFIQNIPLQVSRGFYYGSDQYVWGREFLHLRPDTPRQLEVAKHWYHWMLWGRLGYDPTISNQRFQQILQSRFPRVPADQLLTAWQAASMIYPLTTGFHWGALDFQWYIEGCQSRPGPAQTETGFHDVNRFITLAPHARAGCLSVEQYLKQKYKGTKFTAATPAQVSQTIHRAADRALEILDQLHAAENRELRHTLSDIRAMAYLGKYYAHKIRAAQELGEYRQTNDEAFQQRAIDQLNRAAHYWRHYAAVALAQYKNPLWTNRVGHVDWRVNYQRALEDIVIAGGQASVASMPPSRGDHVVVARLSDLQGVAERQQEGGNAFLEPIASDGDSTCFVEWLVEVPARGSYVLELQYGLKKPGEFPCRLTVNGQDAGELVCWTTGGRDTSVWDRQLVRLDQGKNVVRLDLPAAVLVQQLRVLPGTKDR